MKSRRHQRGLGVVVLLTAVLGVGLWKRGEHRSQSSDGDWRAVIQAATNAPSSSVANHADAIRTPTGRLETVALGSVGADWRDPFGESRTLLKREEGQALVQAEVSAVWVQDGIRMAVIEGGILAEGARFRGMPVLRVVHNGVWIGGDRWCQRLSVAGGFGAWSSSRDRVVLQTQ